MTIFLVSSFPIDVSNLEQFLKHGGPGLAAILAILAFGLLAYGIIRKSLGVLSVLAIVIFMIFSCVLMVLSLEKPSYVKVDGKIVDPPDPTSVNVAAARIWRICSPSGDGRLTQKLYEDAAEIRLLFWTGDYGEAVSIRQDQIKDGCCDLGEIKLRKGFDPHRLLADIENYRFVLYPR